MWFKDWTSLGRIALATCIAYAYMLTLVRTGGKRIISKKNASDFIITVAIGSTVAAMAMSRDVTIADGLVGVGVLLALQFCVVTLSTRWEFGRRAIEGRPCLLYYKGRVLRETARAEEVNDSEIMQAIRNSGHSCLEGIFAVVLEIDGSFSVITEASQRPTALVDVKGIPDEELAEIRRRLAPSASRGAG